MNRMLVPAAATVAPATARLRATMNVISDLMASASNSERNPSSKRPRVVTPEELSFGALPMPTDEGGQISHYRILKRLGSGGMGVVFEGEDLSLGRHVALKFLSADRRHAQAHERFRLEAR